MDLPVCVSRSQGFTRNANSVIELPGKMYPTILCAEKCPKIRPQRYSTLQKPISGCQPQAGSDRVALINIAVSTLGNGQTNKSCSVSPRTKIYHVYLTVNNDCSAAASHQLIVKQTTRHTSNCACNLPEPRTHMECVFQYNSHP